jgi:hypothetical protein
MSKKEGFTEEEYEELMISLPEPYALTTARELLRKKLQEKRAAIARENLARELLRGLNEIREELGVDSILFQFEDGSTLEVTKDKKGVRFRLKGAESMELTEKDLNDENVKRLLKYSRMQVTELIF